MPRRAERRRLSRPLALVALVAAGCGDYGGGGASGAGEYVGNAGAGAAAGVARGEARALGAPVLESQASGTSALLQAVSPVDDTIVWVSGHEGSYARTLDGGATWTGGVVPGADTLEFRDVHALSADVAWLLSAGPGELSRIYHTVDGGATWTLQWMNEEPDGFYDCLDFWDAEHGAAYGDAVEGELRILRTVDGGRHWERLAGSALPAALLGEGGFAASGTCLVTGPEGRAWVATGNAQSARILRTDDYGATWKAYDTPIPGGEGAGLFSVAFRDSLHGAIFGGSLGEPAPGSDAAPAGGTAPRAALSDDGGVSWDVATQPAVEGAIFGGTWVPRSEPPGLVVVAPTGAAYSEDGGETWGILDSHAYWGLGFASPDAGWLVGPDGRITKVSFGDPSP